MREIAPPVVACSLCSLAADELPMRRLVNQLAAPAVEQAAGCLKGCRMQDAGIRVTRVVARAEPLALKSNFICRQTFGFYLVLLCALPLRLLLLPLQLPHLLLRLLHHLHLIFC